MYFYCIVPGGRVAVPDGLLGIERSAIRVIDVERPEASAWVSDLGALPRTDAASLRRLALEHDGVVSAALRSGVTPIPARANQIFATDADLIVALAERADAYATALAKLDGLVEMTAAVGLPGDASTQRIDSFDSVSESAGAGTRHLEMLRRRADDAHRVRIVALAVADELTRVVQDLTLGAAVRAHSRPRPGVAVSHLVARERAEEYRERLSGYRVEANEAAVVTGPTAPYSFAGVTGK